MDGKLLEILACPVSRQHLARLDAGRRDALFSAIEGGKVVYVDDVVVTEQADDVLVTDDEQVLYLVIDGIPVLLPERGIGTTQFQNFAEGHL